MFSFDFNSFDVPDLRKTDNEQVFLFMRIYAESRT